MKGKLKILFATDFSPCSKEALETLKQLKSVFSVEIHLIHVVSSFWKDWISSGAYQKEAMERLASWQTLFLNENDHQKLHIKQGNPADSIISLARELKIHLVLMAFHKEKDSARYKTHHTVDSVVRHAQQSVWVTQSAHITHLLCGVDGSKNSMKALEKAIDLARRFKAPLELVFVFPQIDFNPIGLSQYQKKEAEETFKEKQTQDIEVLLNKIDASDIKVKKHYQWGRPADVILGMAEDLDISLIIIGAKGKDPLRHILMGSTAAKVLRHVPCSLWVVR